MSRSPGTRPRQARTSPGPSIWYVACIGLGSACLYIEPTWQPNKEPEITEPPDYQNGEEVVVDLDFVTGVLVIAKDEDSDQISCVWDHPLERDDWTCTREDSFVISQLALPYDPELDGKQITAHILDDLSGADVQVKFRIRVGGEE